MRVAGRILTGLVLLAGPLSAQESNRAVGSWHGTLATPRGDLVLIVSIEQDSAGTLRAALEVPAQAPGRLVPIPDIAATADSLTFAIPAIGAAYRGAWVADPGQWAGVFTQGIELPLTLGPGRPAAGP